MRHSTLQQPSAAARLATALCVAASLMAIGSVAGRAAGAIDYPPRKPGLWQMSVDTGRGPAQTMQYCIDAATDAALMKMGQASMGQACSKFDARRSGTTVTTDSVCNMGNAEVTTHSVTTFTGETATHTVATSHFSPPMPGGMADATMTRDGKWMGPCGPDMQPGDMMINGNRMRMPMGQGGQPQ